MGGLEIQRFFFKLILGFITLFFNNYSVNDTLQLFDYFGNTINTGVLIENIALMIFSICLVLILFLIERKHARNAIPSVSVLLLIIVVLMWPEESKTFIYEF